MKARTILIVEDNALNMKLFDDILQTQGYETLLSRDGGDVLELAAAHHLDLIVMDIQLNGPVRFGIDQVVTVPCPPSPPAHHRRNRIREHG